MGDTIAQHHRAAAERSRTGSGAEMSVARKRDPRLEEMIDAAVLGDTTSPWDIDPKYPAVGSLQDKFEKGDNQLLLWTIHFSARKGEPVPEWAAKALAEVLYAAAAGEFKSWDKSFGRIFGEKSDPPCTKRRAR